MRAVYSNMRSRGRHPSGHVWPRTSLLLAGLVAMSTALLLCPAPATAQAPSDQSPTSLTLLRDAARAFRTGEYDRAADLAGAIADRPEAVVLHARALRARGKYDEAVELLTPAASADPGGDAALELGSLQLSLGRAADAEKLLTTVLARNVRVQDPPNLARAASAARWLGHFQQANDLFRDAVVLQTDDAAVQTAWGDLLLDKHNAADAARSFRQAMQIDRTFPAAYLGLARVTVDTNPAMARDIVTRVLRFNPNFVDAHVLAAELALDDENVNDARAALQRALDVNPASLEARSLLAAIENLEDRPESFDAEVQRVLAINPHYSGVYRVAGEQAAKHYRFDEAVTLTRRAVQLDPADARAHADLGMHLLRTGDERAARETLDAAFRLDPYDVVTYNLLGLLDTLDRFVTVEDGPIVMRMDRDEAPILREQAMPLAQEALRTLAARYGVTPSAPILIEIFPRHDDFAVRNLGLPGMIGALGACFGRVVTLDSPRARPPGTFSWQAALWHEMAHVVTLQLSKQRVPRWLTEGISVYEERRTRPGWGREMQFRFVEAMQQGAVLPLAELNAGFSNPETISLAYYQASLVVQHIVESRGEEPLRALLRAYGDGLDTDKAIQKALGEGLPQLQASFDAALERQFSTIRSALDPPPEAQLARATDLADYQDLGRRYPNSYPVLVTLAQTLDDAGETEAAIEAWRKSVQLVPQATGDESPRARLITLLRNANDTSGEAAALEDLLAYDYTNVDAARQLVTLLGAPTDAARALKVHQRIAELDPFDSASSSALGREALAGGDAAAAARWFRTALATGPRDPVGARCDLADAYLRLGNPGEAKHETLAALEIAPTYPRAQDLLLSIVEAQP